MLIPMQNTKTMYQKTHHADHKRASCPASDYCFFHKSEVQLLAGCFDRKLDPITSDVFVLRSTVLLGLPLS